LDDFDSEFIAKPVYVKMEGMFLYKDTSMSQRAWYKRLTASGRRLSMADRYYERGLHHFTKDKPDLALADLDAAIEHLPQRAEYYIARGIVLLQSGSPEEAEENFAYGLSLDPTQWLAHYGRGMRAFRESEYEQAINLFSRAQHIAPDRAEIYFYRAVALYQAGQQDQAQRDMEFVLQLWPRTDKRRALADQWLTLFKKAGN
jgi:tetratricopeptide (TPR) repeat protein